jgi:phosphoglycerate kinase
MPKRSIAEVDVAGRTVLTRVDFNVPLEDGRITDDRRIRAALPTIRSILDRGGRAVLMSHLGRPEGKGFEAEHSLRPVADRLGELLGRPVRFPPDERIETAAGLAGTLQDGEVLLLENLRFHKGEKKGDPAFAAALASLGEIYCNDAFGTSHRTDASMHAVPLAMRPRPAVAGFLLRDELRYLQGVVAEPARPFVAILGGAKVSDKLAAIRFLLERVDRLIVGGAMAYTLLKARGVGVGRSLVEASMEAEAAAVLEQSERLGHPILLPSDHLCAAELRPGAEATLATGEGPEGLMGLDIGPESIRAFAEAIAGAGTVVWNGPMGVFEMPPFDAGTRGVGEAVAAATRRGAVTVVGGGDTAAAVERFGIASAMSHVSTGGGASMEMLEGREFESLAVLDEA